MSFRDLASSYAEPAYRPTNKSIAVALTASCFGWALDLFDLFLLLYVAPYVGKAFFPSHNATLTLAAVYASFAVTLCMRPVGSAIFGSYADKRGRKGAMMVAMTGVGLSTAAFGLLPGYASIGLWAPIIFLILRLVQGVFVGGVVASTHTIGTESVPRKWRGLVSGLIGGGGAGLGALLASISFLVMSSIFVGAAFDDWGWRAMFLSGILSAVFGLTLFNSLEESPLWKQLREAPGLLSKEKAATPLKALFSAVHRKTLLVNLLLTVSGGSVYYLTAGYLPTYLRTIDHVTNHTASLLLVGAALASIVAGLMFGQLAEVLGRKKAFLLIGLIGLLVVPYSFIKLSTSVGITPVACYSLIIAFMGNAVLAPLPIFLNERFPTAIRASGTGLSWNVGFAVGGSIPVLVTLSSASLSGLPITLAIFTAVFFAVYVIGAVVSGETKGHNM
ncbi:Proline/betaine transporter (plasmid) [Caballeronia sp. SBC1]|uniref:MFS transporter n=1 Tax=unclassified Caballeronia TaxID=2646786 RepID=UPI0013E1BF0D|nr:MULTISPECIES: MFS transporter [unclassified Caballeronia]QIE27199.1 Proline/betaine transporter [Caballeronia sp. SBC2]QIN65322.1 Proline/betaine transporter [Caballeronia sp. SBC1]